MKKARVRIRQDDRIVDSPFEPSQERFVVEEAGEEEVVRLTVPPGRCRRRGRSRREIGPVQPTLPTREAKSLGRPSSSESKTGAVKRWNGSSSDT